MGVRSINLRHWLAVVLVSLAAPAWGVRCTADTIASASFESLPGVHIAGLVGGLESGTLEARHGSQTLGTAAFSAGSYSLEIPATAPEALIELRAIGTGAQAYIELASFVGTLQQLRDEADPDGITRIGQVPTLAVSAETTARYSLLGEALATASAPTHECQLARLTAEVSQSELYRRAAIVQILVQDGLPAGKDSKGTSSTILGLLADPQQREQTAQAIETRTPGRITTLADAIATPFCNYFLNDALLVLKERQTGQLMNVRSGTLLERTGDGTGNRVDFRGTDAYQSTCAGDALDLVVPAGTVLPTNRQKLVDGVLTFVPANLIQLSLKITRVEAQAENVLVASYSTVRASYPNHPQFADETLIGEGRQVLIRRRIGSPYQSAEVPGEYLMPSSGGSRDFEFNRVRLDLGGAGEDLDVGGSVAWSVLGDGELVLQFADRSSRLIPIRNETPSVRDVLALTDFADGRRAIAHHLAIRRTDVGGFWSNAIDMPFTWLAQDGRASALAYFQFKADRSAPFVGAGQLFFWTLQGPGNVVLRRCRKDGVDIPVLDREPAVGECSGDYRRREWTLYSVSNDVYYLHEVQRHWQGVADPANTPPNGNANFSRANFYGKRAADFVP